MILQVSSEDLKFACRATIGIDSNIDMLYVVGRFLILKTQAYVRIFPEALFISNMKFATFLVVYSLEINDLATFIGPGFEPESTHLMSGQTAKLVVELFFYKVYLVRLPRPTSIISVHMFIEI